MIKTKISFGLLILFFALLIVIAPFFYKNTILSHLPLATSGFAVFQPRANVTNVSTNDTSANESKSEIVEYNISSYDLVNRSNCYLLPPLNKTIILRIDDLGAYHYYSTVVNMTNDILERNLSVSFGVIPFQLERDRKFIDFIKSIDTKPNIEIAQHGYHHDDNEFQNLTYFQAHNITLLGRESIINNFGIIPVTFIPPSNAYNNETAEALKNSGFLIVSAFGSEFKTDGSLNYIGADVETYDFYHKTPVSNEEVLYGCKKSLEMKNLCIILMHPQDFVDTNDPAVTDPVKYSRYTQLLDNISSMNVSSKTFKDLVSCPQSQS